MGALRTISRSAAQLVGLTVVARLAGSVNVRFGAGDALASLAADAQVLRGRAPVIDHACGDCHGGFSNPSAEGWLAGTRDTASDFKIGPFVTRPRNLTPDNTTGSGGLASGRSSTPSGYGLRPGETPDVTISSTTPGQGNFPMHPKYLAVPMPWPAFRHMSDQEIHDIAPYLRKA